jgi:LCP family protein required for cell wall assembly
MSMQTVPPPGVHRPRRAATAAQVRRRHFALLLVLILGGGILVTGLLLIARFVAPWGNLTWLLGEPRFLDRPRSVLLIGLDRQGRGARGDLYAVARLDPRFPAATFMAVPVETQTTIPGYGVGKLKDVPAVDRGPLARQTIEALLGLSIDRLVVIEPADGETLIDKLGGIEVLIPKAAAYKPPDGGPAIALEAGRKRLDGKHAIAYARLRSGDSGDLKRIARQQFVVSSAIREAARSPFKLGGVLDSFMKSAEGDLQPTEAEEIIRFLQNIPTTRFVVIPGNPGYDGAWIPNPGRIAALLDRLENPRERSGSPSPMAEIRFSAAREQAADRLADTLVDRGVTVVRSAPLEEDEATYVIAREPSGRVDHIVRALLPAAPWVLSDDPSPYSADYTVVIGKDAPEIRP